MRARAFARLASLVNHALGEHRPNWELAIPNSLLRAIKLWYILTALPHSPGGCIKRLAIKESGDFVLLLPWLMT